MSGGIICKPDNSGFELTRKIAYKPNSGGNMALHHRAPVLKVITDYPIITNGSDEPDGYMWSLSLINIFHCLKTENLLGSQ